LYERVGCVESGRSDVPLTEAEQNSLTEILKREPAEIGNRRVERINRLDGVKFIFADDSWLLLRPSGTEPLVRIYAEADTRQEVDKMLEQGRAYLLN
jgi:phosphomannomutase